MNKRDRIPRLPMRLPTYLRLVPLYVYLKDFVAVQSLNRVSSVGNKRPHLTSQLHEKIPRRLKLIDFLHPLERQSHW